MLFSCVNFYFFYYVFFFKIMVLWVKSFFYVCVVFVLLVASIYLIQFLNFFVCVAICTLNRHISYTLIHITHVHTRHEMWKTEQNY